MKSSASKVAMGLNCIQPGQGSSWAELSSAPCCLWQADPPFTSPISHPGTLGCPGWGLHDHAGVLPLWHEKVTI